MSGSRDELGAGCDRARPVGAAEGARRESARAEEGAIDGGGSTRGEEIDEGRSELRQQATGRQAVREAALSSQPLRLRSALRRSLSQSAGTVRRGRERARRVASAALVLGCSTGSAALICWPRPSLLAARGPLAAAA